MLRSDPARRLVGGWRRLVGLGKRRVLRAEGQVGAGAWVRKASASAVVWAGVRVMPQALIEL